MTEVPVAFLAPLLRATVLLAVSAVLLRVLIRWLRPSSPTIQQVGWFLVLVQGVVLFHLPLRVAWSEAPSRAMRAAVADPQSEPTLGPPPAADAGSPAQAMTPVPATGPVVDSSPAADSTRPVAGISGAAIAATIWFAGMLALSLIGVAAYVRFLWRLRGAQPAPEAWRQEWSELFAAGDCTHSRAGDYPDFRAGDCPDFRAGDCPDLRAGDCPDFRAAKMGLSPSRGRPTIPLLVTDNLGPAMCWTPRGYRVVVPERTWKELSHTQRRAVLRHELAHWRRRDLWLTLLARLLALPHWFNPLAWWAVHKFAECAEWACDHLAAGRRRVDATDYARALLLLGATTARLPACATMARKGSLFMRIRRVISAGREKDSIMKKTTILVVAAALVAANVVRVELVAREPSAADAPPSAADDSARTPRTDLYGDPLPAGAIARLGTVRFHYQGIPTDMAFSPDGSSITSVFQQEGAIRWDSATGRPLGTSNPDMDFDATCFSPDRKLAASVVVRNTGNAPPPLYELALWNVATGQKTWSSPIEGITTFYVVFAPDGNAILVASENGLLSFWDTFTGNEVLSYQVPTNRGIESVAFSPDSQTVAIAGRDGLWLWDWTSGNEPRIIPTTMQRIDKVAFSPDGKVLSLVVGDHSSSIQLVEAATGRVLHTLGSANTIYDTVPPCFSPDGKQLAAYNFDIARIEIWDTATGKITRSFDTHAYRRLAFSPDGRRLAAVGSNVISIWDIATGKLTPELDRAHQASIYYTAFIGGGSLVGTCGDDGTARVWEADTGRQRLRLEHHAEKLDVQVLGKPRWVVTALAASPDGKLLASSGLDDAVRVWDVASGRQIHRLPGHGRRGSSDSGALAFTSDGKRLASFGDDMDLRVFDLETGEVLTEHHLRPGGVDVAANANVGLGFIMNRLSRPVLSADARILVFRVMGDVFAFDVDSGKELSRFGHMGSYIRLAISPDAQTLLTSDYGTRELITLPNGQTRSSLPEHHVLRLWNVSTGEILSRFELPGRSPGPVAFSPDGTRFASATNARLTTIRVWDAAERRLIWTAADVPGSPHSLAFSADGRRLAAGLWQGYGLVWELDRTSGLGP